MGESQISAAKIRLQQLDQPVEHESIVVQVGVEMGFAVFVGREQAAIFPERRAQKIDGALGGVNPFLITENDTGAGHAFDHQAVPTGEDFFIATGMNALLTHGK